MDTINRLQFRHHEEIFDTREDALKYICKTLPREGGEGLAEPGSPYTRSLFAEPTILRYMNTEEEGTCDTCNKGPHIILVIGSQTNDEELAPEKNTYCIIDIDKTEDEIKNLEEELEKAIKSLTLIVTDSATLDLTVEKTEDGTILSGDVKTPPTHIFDGLLKENNLLTIPTGDLGGQEGLFIYVGLTYDEETESFTFAVTGLDENGKPVLKKQTVSLPNNFLTGGSYDIRDESIHLRMKNGDEILVDCKELIYEWEADPGTSTPIVLNRERVRYEDTPHHHHSDLLTADIRIDENRPHNILSKSINGRSIYVDGTAKNIYYAWNGEPSDVEAQLNKLNMIRISPDHNNILQDRTDGYYAEVSLDYVSAENKLIFKATNVSGEITENEIQLNTVDIPIENIIYNPTTEELIILWKNDKGEIKRIVIPIGEMIQEWEVLNPGHNVTLNKVHQVAGKDQLSADVNIYGQDAETPELKDFNILEDRDHSLYVKGTADNIKYGNVTVKGALDNIDDKIGDEIIRAKTAEEALGAEIEAEVTRREAADSRLDNKIGTGFTDDPHENVTFKFEALSAKTDGEITRATAKETEIEEALSAEVARATTAEAALNNKIDSEIARSTEKDNEHDAKIAELSADTRASLKHVVNEDKSVNVTERDGETGKEAVVKVNLSTEVEDDRKNIIKLNSDGLFSNVDLNYIPEANKLIFHTSNGEPDKEIQLESMSSIISIEYNPTKEAIVITYMTNGHEIKTVEIPVGDLINEWRVEDGHPHAVQLEKVRVASGTSEQDVLKASVVITEDHDDNILVMDGGTLYVPGQQIEDNKNAIAQLTNDLEAEASRATAAEIALHDEIEAETNRATAAESRIEAKIDNEITRAISAETALNVSISTVDTNLQNEIGRATAAENRIEAKIDNEISRAQGEENELNAAITAETLRAQEADNELYHGISDEASARVLADADLLSKINQETARAQLIENTISSNLQAETTRSTAKDNELEAAIDAETQRAQDAEAALEDAIEAAKLSFDDTTSIDFTKTVGNVVTADVKLQNGDNIIKLGQGLYASVHLSYDVATNKLKLTTSAGSDEFQLAGATVIDNLYYDNESGEIVIIYHDGSGNVQTVRFPASELFNEWIVQNLSEGSAIELTKRRATEQGQPDELSARVLLTNLDDNAIQIVNNGLYVPTSASTLAECTDKKANKLYELLYGVGSSMQDCGDGTSYRPYPGACIISGASSFNEADMLLNDQICEILNMWVSGMTCTNVSEWVEDGANRKIEVNTRLSHGNTASMSDEELLIRNIEGPYIDPTTTEFTSSNVLRVVCLSEAPEGQMPSVDSWQNGIYLSSTWDCGLYYDEIIDAEAMDQARFAGYDPYTRVDTASTACNYDYNNNVRQTDIPHV